MPGEHQPVQRRQRVPVQQAGQAHAGRRSPSGAIRAPGPSGLDLEHAARPGPGSFISASRRRRRSGTSSSTRQKSSGSPARNASGSRRPRRMPTPPASRSRAPRARQSHVAVIPAGLAADPLDGRERPGGRGTRRSADRASTRRVPNRAPPQRRGSQAAGDGSAQWVSAISPVLAAQGLGDGLPDADGPDGESASAPTGRGPPWDAGRRR